MRCFAAVSPAGVSRGIPWSPRRRDGWTDAAAHSGRLEGVNETALRWGFLLFPEKAGVGRIPAHGGLWRDFRETRTDQGRDGSCAAAQLRHSPHRWQRRRSNCPGAAGPRQPRVHDDLHPHHPAGIAEGPADLSKANNRANDSASHGDLLPSAWFMLLSQELNILTSMIPATARSAQESSRKQNLGRFFKNSSLYFPISRHTVRHRAAHPLGSCTHPAISFSSSATVPKKTSRITHTAFASPPRRTKSTTKTKKAGPLAINSLAIHIVVPTPGLWLRDSIPRSEGDLAGYASVGLMVRFLAQANRQAPATRTTVGQRPFPEFLVPLLQLLPCFQRPTVTVEGKIAALHPLRVTELHIQTFPALEMQLSAHHFAGEHLRVDSGKGQDRTLRLLSALWPPVFAGEQDVGPPKG